jgi:TolB protein
VRPSILLLLPALVLAAAASVAGAEPSLPREIVYRNDHPCDGNPCGKSEIHAVTANGKFRRRLTRDSYDDFSPALSPDGRRVVFVRATGEAGNLDLWLMNRRGRRQLRLTYTPTVETEPDWAPDGKRIVFRSSAKDGNSELYAIGVRGGTRVQLTRTPANEVNPAWSPDGHRIAYQRNNGSVIEIAVLDLRTHKTKRIGPGFSPTWSPDSRRIAYAASQEGQFELFIVGASGGRPEQVTTDGGEEPSWSPDGRKLVFEWDGQLFTVMADGTNRRQLTRPGSGLNVEPDW